MDIKVDVNEMAKQLSDALKPLADKLGSTTAHVYALAVKDVYISGIYEAVCCVLLLTVCVASVLIIIREANSKSIDVDGSIIAVAFFILTLSSVTLFFALSSCLHDLLNPEYQALLSMLHAVTGK
jgi:hypothetical protein